jgi:uncharacterized protein
MNQLILENKNGVKFYYDSVNNKISTKINSENNLRKQIFPKIIEDENYQLNITNARQQLVLSVTENCNLRCTYCIYHDDRYTNEEWNHNNQLSFENAKKAIDLFLNNSTLVTTRYISFYGGEPLLNFKLIRKCIAYVENNNRFHNVKFTMTTNALLLKDKILNCLISYDVLINVSLDGAKDIHDRYRVDRNKSPSFDIIIANLLYIKKTHKNYFDKNITFSSVVAPPVNKKSLLDYLEILQQEVTLNDIDITKHMNTYMKNNNISNITELDEKIDIDSYPKLMGAQKQKYLKVLNILEEKENYTYIPGGYCIPLLKKTFVSTDGKYYICEKFHQIEENSYGDINSDINIKKIYFLTKKIKNFMNSNCNRCWASRFCDLCHVHLSENNISKKCDNIRAEYINILKMLIENNLVGVKEL